MLSLAPEIAHKKIVVVIPVFNDGEMVRQVVEELISKTSFCIVVVDDGSAIPVKEQLRRLPVVCLRHKMNLGQGAALQTGFAHALRMQPDIVVTFDADGQHAVEDLPRMIAPIVEQVADVVLGSRFMQGENTATIPFSRKVVLKTGRIINYLLCGILLSDAHNGLRAFSRAALEKIVITENRMAHASEILFEIGRRGLVYKEVPVTINYTDYSKQKGQSAWDSVKILFDLVLHKFFR